MDFTKFTFLTAYAVEEFRSFNGKMQPRVASPFELFRFHFLVLLNQIMLDN